MPSSESPFWASGSCFPALPPPWPQTWGLRKVVVAPTPNLTCQTSRWWRRPRQTRWPPKWTCMRHCHVASEGTDGGSNVITGIPTKFVSAAFGCELQVYHDGTARSVLGRLIHLFQQNVTSGKSPACKAWGSASFSFKSSPWRTEVWRGSTLLPFFTCSHMRLFSMVDFPMPWETLTTQKEGGAQSFTSRWIDKVLDAFLLERPCRGGLFPFQPLPSLPHCPVHEEARKEPLHEWELGEPALYYTPCAQQSPTSLKGLRRKSPCGLCSCMTAWKDEPAWRKLNLPRKDASAECRRKGTIQRFSQFVPN